jgi:ABC-2 type transport system permease protein
MSGFFPALWAETLKARRSWVTLMTIVAFMILPIIDGLFMFILKDPERARAMGLMSAKAQMLAGTADWPSFFQVLLLGTAVGGAILYSFITAWVFGREFVDHTAKEILALPTPRRTFVSAKLVLIAAWVLTLTLVSFLVALGIGKAVVIPGWSPTLAWDALLTLLLISLLTVMLMPLTAFFASAGRGYLPPLLWAFFTMILGQIAGILGWADWFPWSVPALPGSANQLGSAAIPFHSYLLVLIVFAIGLGASITWWQSADQAR